MGWRTERPKLSVMLLFAMIAGPQDAGALALTHDAAVQALARLPELRQQQPGEPFEVTQMAPVPGDEDRAWYVAVQWLANGTLRTGIALVTRPEIKKRERVPVSPDSPWNVAEFTPDQTWDELQEDLRRARIDADELAATSSLRDIVRAQIAFAAAGGGGFAPTLACLFEPASCAPVLSRQGPFLTDQGLRSGEQSGYRFACHAGPPAPARQAGSRVVATYACTAAPIAPGDTGLRTFCADSTGAVCQRTDGRTPEAATGLCAQPCGPIR